MAAELLHADRQDEAISRFAQLCERTWKCTDLGGGFSILVLSTDIFVKLSLVSFGTLDFEQIKLIRAWYKIDLYRVHVR